MLPGSVSRYYRDIPNGGLWSPQDSGVSPASVNFGTVTNADIKKYAQTIYSAVLNGQINTVNFVKPTAQNFN